MLLPNLASQGEVALVQELHRPVEYQKVWQLVQFVVEQDTAVGEDTVVEEEAVNESLLPS